MTYQVLARKWRPQDFSSVVGQQPIVTALRNALTEGRIAQAYLFSGIRGVGKTSVARILAKALNCEKGPAGDPCNECTPCRDITRGSDLDVLEVDAATYSKVEQVRELTESLKYGPARDRYKVVVIDEIHRLSRQAFDALLKIVEEPPPHLVFIFATTEAEAVPATILSRCQEFRFRRVASGELATHLRRLAEAERIEVSEPALRLVARAGDGSVRDSVALLDQLATFGSGSISDDEAARILGGVDHAVFFGLLEAIVEGKSGKVAEIVREIEQQGWDPRHVFADFLGYCREALHLSLGGRPAEVDLPEEEAAALADLARGAGYENLLRMLHQLLGSENGVRRSEAGILAVEIAWLRAAELPKLVRVEQILGGGGQPAPAAGKERARRVAKKTGAKPAKATPKAGKPTVTEEAPAAIAPAAAEAPRPETVADPGPPPTAPPASVAKNEREQPAKAPAEVVTEQPAANDGTPPSVESFLEQVSQRKQSLAAHLAEAHELVFENGQLRILAPPRDPWLTNALQRDSNRKVMEQSLAATWGPGVTWRLVESAARKARQEAPDPALAEAAEDPRVQAVLDIFGGTVESVKDH